MLKDSAKQERRKYERLDSVFPVEFRFVSFDGKRFLSDWLQGFTRNISKGGICLETANLTNDLAATAKNKKAKLFLKIEIPVSKNPVSALASVAWLEEEIGSANKRYFLGLSYENIDSRQNNKIFYYTRAKKLFVQLMIFVIAVFAVALIINGSINTRLIDENKMIVEQLGKVMRESEFSIAKQKIKEISKERRGIELDIQSLQFQIETIEKEKIEKSKIGESIEELNNRTKKLVDQRIDLEDKISALQRMEDMVTNKSLHLDKKNTDLEKVNLNKIFQRLRINQSPRTGLVMSLGGNDRIARKSFIYDQSLVAQTYMVFLDFERAKKILDFFSKKAKRNEFNLFYDCYYTNDGIPAEYTVHSDSNIWVGIAALHYTEKTKDNTYFYLAEEIAQALCIPQNSGEGFSIEQKLTSYAFFNMLYKIDGKDQYRKVRDSTLEWVKAHITGSSGIDIDTYVCLVAAAGPDKLEELGIDVDRIMDSSEQISQKRLSRGIRGYSERAAQMAVSFKIIAGSYYKKNMISKALSYETKAATYLETLLIPKVESADSWADIAYTLFVLYDYNPLSLEKGQ